MNLEGQNIEYKRIWKDDYLKWVSGFDDAGLKRPSFKSEQGGITTIIPREVFMAVRGNVIGMMNDGFEDMKRLMVKCGLRHLQTFRENYVAPALRDGTKYQKSKK